MRNRKHPILSCFKLRILRTILPVLLLLIVAGICSSSVVLATSYLPESLAPQQERLEGPFRSGETIYLFYSGTADIRKTIQDSDILTVYRTNHSTEMKIVGKIKVLSYMGEVYLKGVVIEGEIMPNDIARKGDVSCLVISAPINLR